MAAPWLGDRTQLREWLERSFDEEELRTLCFDLLVDYESLGGQGKAGKVRALIAYMERHNRIEELIQYCAQKRLDFPWKNVPKHEISSQWSRGPETLRGNWPVEPSVGIVAASPIEYEAVQTMIEHRPTAFAANQTNSCPTIGARYQVLILGIIASFCPKYPIKEPMWLPNAPRTSRAPFLPCV